MTVIAKVTTAYERNLYIPPNPECVVIDPSIIHIDEMKKRLIEGFNNTVNQLTKEVIDHITANANRGNPYTVHVLDGVTRDISDEVVFKLESIGGYECEVEHKSNLKHRIVIELFKD